MSDYTFKKLKIYNTTLILPYTQNNFSSMKPHFRGRLRRFILVGLQSYVLNSVIKDSFFIAWMIFLRNRLFLCLERRHRYGYVIFLILSTKSMGNPNNQLAHFFYLFQMAADYWLGYVEVLEYLCGLHSTNIRKASWLKFDEHLGRRSTLTRRKLWKSVSDLMVSNDTLAINIFFSCLCSVFIILEYYITCTFSSTILGAWDRRSNCDVHSFTTEIKMTAEDSLKSSNFWLRLKQEVWNAYLLFKKQCPRRRNK